MTKLWPSPMEVTSALSNSAKAAHFSFGEDTAIIAVQHMLWQTLDLLEAVIELGVKRENIFALGKVYSNSPVVIGALRDRGITVVESTIPEPGEFDHSFQRDVNRLLEVVTHNLESRQIRRILLLDDGGRCITSMPPHLLHRYAVSGVEQTSFGIFLFEKKPPPFSVMSWARTAVKLQIGGPIFSHCLLMKLQSRVLGGDTLMGESVGVIGLGSIGSAMANLAARQHNNVLFYDPDPDLQIPRYLHGRITRADSLEDLMLRCDYVFGCSGRQPFKNRWPLQYRPGIKLFSASGGDQEFGPIIDDLKTRPGFNVTFGDWDICSDDGPCGPISIAYLGYPYNFVSRDLEAVPTAVVQVEIGGLLAGLIQARIHLALCERGYTQNSGIHRIAPPAQQFVYENWLGAMRARGIDLEQVYGYDPLLLDAARHRWWFVENSEPLPSRTSGASYQTEQIMAHMLEEGSASQLGSERQLEPDLCSF